MIQFTADREGYLYIYTSNESNLNVNVYFDNLTITHDSHASVLQADDYYPFGLPMDNNNFIEAGIRPNRFLYQGKEWQTELGLNLYDFHARQFDPALGRFLAVDAASQFSSPYLGMGNMPTYSVDPDGNFAFIPALITAFKILGYARTAISTFQAIQNGNWKQVGLNVGMFALGGLNSKGVDAIIGEAEGILPELSRAALNGLSSGGISRLAGGDFSSGFLNGAGTSLAISGLQGLQELVNESKKTINADSYEYDDNIDLGSITIEAARSGLWSKHIHGWGNLYRVQQYYGNPVYRAVVDGQARYNRIASNALLTVAPLPKVGLLSKFGGRFGTSFRGGKTFTQFKAKYWRGRVKPKLDPIRGKSPGQVWKQHMELHHRFIPQRTKWAPNWLKNNRFNLKPLSSLEHALRDPYRARFAPKWVKDIYKLKWK